MREASTTAWPRAREAVRPLALAVLVCAGLAHVYYHVAYTLDDAYISFRYARNLARGLGLVYNPGEYVKGYSNTLLTLLAVLPELFGRDPKWFVKLISGAAYVALLLTAAGLYGANDRPEQRDRGLWLVALCAASAAMSVHFVNGLETGLHTLLLFAAVVRRVREQDSGARPYSAALFAFAVLSRPEAIAIFAAIAGYDLLWRVLRRRFTPWDLAFYLIPSAAYATELGLSYAYYGQALPQTYYAKAEAVSGAGQAFESMWRSLLEHLGPKGYLRRGLEHTGLGLLGLLAVPLALFDPQRRRRNGALALALLAQLVFVVRARSDWAPAFRFGVPLLPFLFALTVEAIGALSQLARKHARALGWALSTALLIYSAPMQWRESAYIEASRYVNAENKLIEGAFFATLARPGITLASADIGGHGYGAAGFTIFDAGGLTSPEANCRTRHCGRYAALVLPELLRVRNHAPADMYFVRPALKQHAYLALAAGKYLLRRDRVFMPAAPASATPLSAAAGSPPSAHDAPAAAPIRQSFQCAIYWPYTAEAFSRVSTRRLEWLGPAGHYDARASAPLLQQLTAADWRPGELFSDLTTITTPHRAGTYELQVVAAGTRVRLGTLEVLSETAARAERAEGLVAQARAQLARGEDEAAWHTFDGAVQLSAAARGAYQRAARDTSQRLRREAAELAGHNPVEAFQRVQTARSLLTRAYAESGHATGTLRRELRELGRLRVQLVERVVDAP